jgi:hypothetical protein
MNDRAEDVLLFKVFAAVIYTASVGAWVSVSVVVFVYYGTHGLDLSERSQCVGGDVAAGLNIALGVVIMVVSLIPSVQDASPSARLNATTPLPFLAIATLLVWQAVSSMDEPCNRMPNATAQDIARYAVSAFFVVMIFIYMFFYTFDLDSDATVADLGESVRQELTIQGGVLVTRSIDEDNDEYNNVQYSYSWFHFLLFLLTCYIGLFVTNWLSPVPTNDASGSSSAVQYVMGTSTLAFACQVAGALTIYLAYLIVALKPVCYPNDNEW